MLGISNELFSWQLITKSVKKNLLTLSWRRWSTFFPVGLRSVGTQGCSRIIYLLRWSSTIVKTAVLGAIVHGEITNAAYYHSIMMIRKQRDLPSEWKIVFDWCQQAGAFLVWLQIQCVRSAKGSRKRSREDRKEAMIPFRFWKALQVFKERLQNRTKSVILLSMRKHLREGYNSIIKMSKGCKIHQAQTWCLQAACQGTYSPNR